MLKFITRRLLWLLRWPTGREERHMRQLPEVRIAEYTADQEARDRREIRAEIAELRAQGH